MKMFLIVLALVVLVVLGNALLLRRWRPSKLPESVKAKPDAEDDDSW